VTKNKKVDKNKRLFYMLIRGDMELDQAGFAAATGTSASQVSVYLKGDKTVPDIVLERAVDADRIPRILVPPALRAIRSFRAATRGWSRVDRVMSETFFAELLAWSGEALEAIFTIAAPDPPRRVPAAAPSAADRELAAQLWLRLEPRNAGQRLAMVQENEDFQSCALCELVAAKSIETAPSSPAKALELAELSLRIAELCPGDEWLCLSARGYAWFHIANSRRAANDLPGSDTALSTAASFWEAGTPGESGLFNAAIVLGLEATIRKSQRRFPEALERLEKALAADRGDLRGKLLLTKAQILGVLGDAESSTEVLREAIPHIDEKQEPRTALGVRCEFLRNLCLQGRAAEAEPRLQQAQALAEQLGQEVDLVQVAFIAAKILAGTGRTEEAEEAFEQARHKFASFDPPLAFDYAQVSLDLALLLLKQGRTAEARTLAEEMTWIFTSQGVEREALAALRIFCEAAQQEAATVELTRDVIRFLHRSQHDPELKFDETGEAAAK
jgi:tetratricopeptide (TPR) repeat protein